jgi:hypothetical protein
MPAHAGIFFGGINMKNKGLFLRTLAVAAAVILLFTACGSAPQPTQPVRAEMNYRHSGVFADALIPVKDFETRGLVFTETVFQVTREGGINGEIFTYQALLKEAQKLGADAVINVTMDMQRENVKVGQSTHRQETWYGSALAIRYTNVVAPDTPVSIYREQQAAGGAAVSTDGTAGVLGLIGR